LAGEAAVAETTGVDADGFVAAGAVWPFPANACNPSMEAAGAAFAPSFNPKEFIMFVSPAFVTIENFALQDGQAKKTPRDPSSGFSTFSRLMYVSQLRQTNFIKAPVTVAPQRLIEKVRYHMDFQGVKPLVVVGWLFQATPCFYFTVSMDQAGLQK
jgi:hypothetical protein